MLFNTHIHTYKPRQKTQTQDISVAHNNKKPNPLDLYGIYYAGVCVCVSAVWDMYDVCRSARDATSINHLCIRNIVLKCGSIRTILFTFGINKTIKCTPL